MIDFSAWFLIAVWLTPDLQVETNIVNYYPTQEDCWNVVEQIANDIDEDTPYNWDLTCLERPIVEVSYGK